MYHEQMTE